MTVPVPPCNIITSFLDSGAGQSLIAAAGAFKQSSIRPCVVTIEGVSGNLAITAIGTAVLVVVDNSGKEVLLELHQCLQSNGTHNLLSLSQLLQHPAVTVTLTNEAPMICVSNTEQAQDFHIPLQVVDGMFVLPFEVLSVTDPRRHGLPTVAITKSEEYRPATSFFPSDHPAAGTVMWRAIYHQSALVAYANKTFVCSNARGYREKLIEATESVFIDSTTRPTARRKYAPTDPSSMADLSTRMMGTSYDRLKHTIAVSIGLTTKTGGVRANRFPQGTLKRGQVPAVKKRLVHHLHQASVAEVVFTDTFMSGDSAYAYGQAFVCYRSRYGFVVIMKSRRQAGAAFRQFCADIFRPLILVRDNASELQYGDMLAACLELMVQSAFSTPHTQEEEYAEGFIGRVCQMTSFAMLFAGAPMFLWRYAMLSAVFIYNVTAGWYSAEQVWATPYELVFGEPFPDTSIVVPWGCGALILLRKGERKKFGSRCALVVFAHYATQHPTFTYAFWSPRTGRILYRRDAIFLVDVFPLRWGHNAGCKDGSMIVPYACERAPLSMRGPVKDFEDWAAPTLPSFADLISTERSCDVATDLSLPSPRTSVSSAGRHPAHTAFGSPSAVCVPAPSPLSLRTFPVGTTFSKQFGRHGRFDGTVMSIPSGDSDFYHVQYHDGDHEDLSAADLQQLIHPELTTRPMLVTTRSQSHHPRRRLAVAAPSAGLNGVAWTTPISARRRDTARHPLAEPFSSATVLQPDAVPWSPPPPDSIGSSCASFNDAIPLTTAVSPPLPHGAHDVWSAPTVSPQTASGTTSADPPTPVALNFPSTITGPHSPSEWSASTTSPPRPVALPSLSDHVTAPMSSSGEWVDTAKDYIRPGQQREDWRHFEVFDTDAQCQELVGRVFRNSNQAMCTVTHWDVDVGSDGGTQRWIHFLDSDIEESDKASLPEVQAWVARDGFPATSPAGTELFWSKVCGLYGTPSGTDASSMTTRPPGSITIPMLVSKVQDSLVVHDVAKWPMPTLSKTDIRRMMKAQPSIFKFGVHIPRNDTEADRSPERVQWRAGRTLEWLRLRTVVNAFDGDWTKERILRDLPAYQLADIGHCFFIYNYKCSGECRVRLVYDGSRQSPNTYGETFAPTVRPESTRLFHLYCTEHMYEIGQYDVPQAFLQADAQGDIFFYPPKGCSEFPGQIYRCLKNLYGGKAAARIYYLKFNAFLLTLGFESEVRDPCFFRRYEPSTGLYSLIISHVDDSRVGATPPILKEIFEALYDEFAVTVCDGGRFLGMDVDYDRSAGFAKLHMTTYIKEMVTRFESVDTTAGFPTREITGCLIWCVCCVHGADLMRVKELARKANQCTAEVYALGLKLMYRLQDRGSKGIIFRRHGAGKETVPANRRSTDECGHKTSYYVGAADVIDEFGERDLYRSCDVEEDDAIATATAHIPDSDLFTIVGYTDASFAVNEKMQSISGWIIYCNGSPILWGSLRQTVVVDSSCSAEYVASSICVKKVKELEHMLLFLHIKPHKPYPVYTDSQAAMAISNNGNSMGNVRHLAIRTHLTRCLISIGDIELRFCLSETQVADLMTKIVAAAQETGLIDRFYNDIAPDDQLAAADLDGSSSV